MNHDPVCTKLRELSWRRKLTGAEQAELRAYLGAHPEAQADWEMEAALGEALAQLPDAPVPSNFTARVLQTVERETAQSERALAPRWSWSWRVLLPRVAVAAVVAGLGLFAYQQHAIAGRAALAKHLVAVFDVKPAPSPEVLADFDAIHRLSPSPPPDKNLLSLLQ
jgi:anti-sigma factor RsiW